MMPVCGVDGTTYTNLCLAACNKVAITSLGNCPVESDTDTCVCAMLYAPVCSTTGIRYGSSCQAACHKAQIAGQGECDKS